MSEIILHVSSVDAFFEDARAVAQRIDSGDYTPNTPRIGFRTIDELWRYMTPDRWSLLRKLQELGPTHPDALSAALKRDAGAVEKDLGKLRDIGLVEAERDGRVFVPWSKITAEVSVANAA